MQLSTRLGRLLASSCVAMLYDWMDGLRCSDFVCGAEVLGV